IQTFDLAVCLWVTWRRAVMVNIVTLDKSLEIFRSELFSIIGNDFRRLSVRPDDMFDDFDRCRRGTFFESPGKSCGGGIVDSGDEVAVSVIRLEQFTDEIDFPEFESLLDAVRVNCRRSGCIWYPLVQLTRNTRIQNLSSLFP